MNYAKFTTLIQNALKEDIGKRDLTTDLFIPKDKSVEVILLAKEKAIICGLDIARAVFRAQDKKVKFQALASDGQLIKKGKVLARIKGSAATILTAERVALNFLSLLSGTATETRRYVDEVKPYKVKIMDTRKTMPGLRALQKYAVRIGGGYNHRLKLDEMVLVKDNHRLVVSPQSLVVSMKRAVEDAKERNLKIEIEVKNLNEFKEALRLKPDIIMLDNMRIGDIRRAVILRQRTNDKRQTTKLEASGGITLKNVRKIAATGVERISIGALTDSVKSIDISLEVL